MTDEQPEQNEYLLPGYDSEKEVDRLWEITDPEECYKLLVLRGLVEKSIAEIDKAVAGLNSTKQFLIRKQSEACPN